MSTIYLANDKYFCSLTQGYNVGDTVLYVNTVPNNVPTILVANKGTEDESVLSITGKTSNTLTGVSYLKGKSLNLLNGTILYCLNSEEFINQYAEIVSTDADTLDGYHANATPTANNIPVLDANAKLPSSLLLSSKIITATRDLSAASGDVAYTGVGFQPTSIICLSSIGGGVAYSIGLADSSAVEGGSYAPAGGAGIVETSGYFIVGMVTYPSAFQTGVLKNYGTDGFTITYSKTGSPTGTLNLLFLCFR